MSPADAKRNAYVAPNRSCPCWCWCFCWCEDINDRHVEDFDEGNFTMWIDYGYAYWMK